MKITFCYAGNIGGTGQGYITYHAVQAVIKTNSLYQLIAFDITDDLGKHANEAIRIGRLDEFSMAHGLVNRLLKRIGLVYFLSNISFDLKARKTIKPCDIFHAFASQSFGSMIKAKSLGAKIVADNPNSHPLALHKLMKEEYKIWKVPYPADNRIALTRRLKALDIADKVLVLSGFAYNSFLENGFPIDKVRKVPYGVDTDLFKPGPKKDDVFRVLFIGQISLRKGFQYLLEAWNRLRLKNSELVLIGNITADAKYALAKYEGRINFKLAGPLSDMGSIARSYNQASVAVFPSVEDGFGMVVTEAMASDIPVIVSENTGAKDMIDSGRDGFIVPIRNPQAIKDAILTLYEDRDRTNQMAQAALKKVQDKTWQIYQDRLIGVYKELMQ